MRERYVIIPAGGIGSRMGGDIPKQMLELCGVPVLRRTLDLFLDLPFEVHVIISINMTVKSMWVDYCRKEGLMLRYVLVSGGMTRFHSVRKTMKYLPDGALVAVHDAVRPLLRKEDSSMVDRSQYRLVQTPQVFHSEVLKRAYDTAFSPDFTDDASVVEKSGVPLHLTAGSRFNLKLTTPEDMTLAEAVLRTIL